MPCFALLCRTVPCCAMLCHALPCCAMLGRAVPSPRAASPDPRGAREEPREAGEVAGRSPPRLRGCNRRENRLPPQSGRHPPRRPSARRGRGRPALRLPSAEPRGCPTETQRRRRFVFPQRSSAKCRSRSRGAAKAARCHSAARARTARPQRRQRSGRAAWPSELVPGLAAAGTARWQPTCRAARCPGAAAARSVAALCRKQRGASVQLCAVSVRPRGAEALKCRRRRRLSAGAAAVVPLLPRGRRAPSLCPAPRMCPTPPLSIPAGNRSGVAASRARRGPKKEPRGGKQLCPPRAPLSPSRCVVGRSDSKTQPAAPPLTRRCSVLDSH